MVARNFEHMIIKPIGASCSRAGNNNLCEVKGSYTNL